MFSIKLNRTAASYNGGQRITLLDEGTSELCLRNRRIWVEFDGTLECLDCLIQFARSNRRHAEVDIRACEFLIESDRVPGRADCCGKLPAIDLPQLDLTPTTEETAPRAD